MRLIRGVHDAAACFATQYDSLREAMGGVSGDLLITTEGLLMYFTQPELEEVFSNIRRILEDAGNFRVVNASAVVREVFDVMGLTDFFGM